jgi:hypothetical protein
VSEPTAPAAAPSEPAAAPESAQPAAAPAQPPATPAPARVNPRAQAKAAPAADAAPPAADPKPASNREALKLAKQAKLLQAELDEARPLAKRAKEALSALSAHATAQLAALPKEWQEHVREIVGEDPIAQLKAVTSLQAKGLLKPGAAPAPEAKPGATTAPPASPKAADVSDPDVARLREYEAAKKSGRAQYAATLLAKHSASIEAGRKKTAPAN